MEIRLISRLSDDELLCASALYTQAQWVEPGEDCSFIRKAFAGSFLAAGAFEGTRLVGMARVLSDGVSDAYIQDVAVHTAFRGRGLGSALVRFLVSETRRRGVDWIALVGEPGTDKFYSSLGFEKKEGFALWKWNNDTQLER